MFKFLVLSLLSCFLISGLTLAEDKPTEESLEKERIIAVIDAQLEAFRSGDAEKAYSFATPGIQRQFPNSSIFMQMVMTNQIFVQKIKHTWRVTYGGFPQWGGYLHFTMIICFLFRITRRGIN